MTQSNDMFWDFAVQVQAKNSILIDTPSYLDKDQLRNCIEAGMNSKLALCVCLEKENDKTKSLGDWLDNIKDIDELIHAATANFESIAKASHESTRCANVLTKPSSHANTNNNLMSNNTTSFLNSCPTLPKLTSVECQLLFDNEGCLKCRCVFVPHHSSTCPNNFPNPTNYKQLTQSFVETIKRHLRKPTAAMMPTVNDTNAASVPIPVAAVMGTVPNLAAYMPSNVLRVIEKDSDLDLSVSDTFPIAAVRKHQLLAPKAQDEDLAPFTVPHLFWQCCVNGFADDFPTFLQALIDHGLHAVLISDEFATSLSLKHHKLVELMPIELVMPEEGMK